MFQVSDKVEVTVLKYDRETGRISLGLKQKSADPWTGVAAKYPVGTRVRGRVVSLTDYGAFVELEPGVEGLVHVSEMSWTHEVRHPSRVVSVGDQVEAAVLNVDPGKPENLLRDEADGAESLGHDRSQVPGRDAH